MNGIRHLPNMITMLRIFGVGLIFWLTPFYSAFWQMWVILIYALVAATDFLDGYIARRYNVETDLGKVLDPLADKILVLVFLPLLEMQVISSFPVFIILAREFSVMALRIISAKDGTIIPASRFGKIKTALTLPLCGLLMGRVNVPVTSGMPVGLEQFYKVVVWVQAWPNWIFTVLIWSTVLVTIVSLFDYFWGYLWKKSLSEERGDRENAIKRLKSFVPNIITLGNFSLGCLGIFWAMTGHINTAVSMMLLGTLLDAMDGKIARKLGVSSEFGAKLDSKADMVSFGVLPAVIVYQVFLELPVMQNIWVASVFALAVYWSVRFRLKRFDEGEHSDFFQGIPSPVGASMIGLASISSILLSQTLYPMVILGVCLLMVSTIPYIHSSAVLKTWLRWFLYPSYIAMLLTLIQLAGVETLRIYYIPEVFMGLLTIYVLSPILIKPKKN